LNRLRLAVVGAGHLGRFHAKLLAAMDDVDLVGIVDPLPSARETVAQECETWAFADYREIANRIDGAIVATPTKFHHQVAMDLLRRGVPLLVEKPMATSVGQCEDMVLVARHKNIPLQVGHIERFNPAFVAALPHLREPKFIEATRAAGFTFRSTDIGVVLDLMIHDLDLVMALAGAPVKSVQAIGLAIVGRHEDVAHARLEFENGCVANLSASRVSPTVKREMQVWAQHAYGMIDFGKPAAASIVRPSSTLLRREIDVESLSTDEKAWLRDHLTTEHLPLEKLVVEPRNAMLDEQRDFIDAIRTGGVPRVSGEQGRNVVAVADQILESIADHRWNGRADGPIGPLAVPPLPVLRGPHWEHTPAPIESQRRAG
jgi:predicted dehydrogenase